MHTSSTPGADGGLAGTIGFVDSDEEKEALGPPGSPHSTEGEEFGTPRESNGSPPGTPKETSASSEAADPPKTPP